MSPKHLDVLGLLMMAAGALELIEGTVVGVGILAAWSAGSTEMMAELGLPATGAFVYVPVITGTFTLILAWVLGLMEIGSGFGIYKRKPWGRLVGLIVSVVNLLAFPIGTLVGGYGLFVLLNKGLAAEFATEDSNDSKEP